MASLRWDRTLAAWQRIRLDALGTADNTIVMYSTDNGAEIMAWPDGGMTPLRGEKNTNYEGGWRPLRDPVAERDRARNGIERNLQLTSTIVR